MKFKRTKIRSKVKDLHYEQNKHVQGIYFKTFIKTALNFSELSF